ncbi:MAG: type IV toxin-antitoxin system AbiEi family antitoxin domain-containing protein [Planctomycetota bacterium]|jgi:predicted transcriptional regulator of viral defense system
MARHKAAAEQNAKARAKAIFRRQGGVLRTAEAILAGIHPRTLYQMRDAGELERLGRGLYRLGDLPPLGDPDLVTVALKVPKGVICTISALAFHEITTQVPHQVHVALRRGSATPRIEYPPLRFYRFTGKAFSSGVVVHEIDGVRVQIYGPEKTIADCFKHRNVLGLDTALEALKLYLKRGRPDVEALMQYARVCRVEKTLRPYVEALV